MSAFLTPTAAICARLSSNWTATPVVLENDAAEDQDLTGGFVYCRVNPRNVRFSNINANSPNTRVTGTIEITIFTPINEGGGAGLTAADTIATIFRGQSFSGVVCFNPSVVDKASTKYKNREFWSTILVAPFYYDEILPIL